MSFRDYSHAALMKRKAGLAIAANLNTRSKYEKPFPAVGALTSAALTTRDIGAITYTRRSDDGTTTVEPPCCLCPPETSVQNINVVLYATSECFPAPYEWAQSQYLVTWSPIEGATYTVTCTSSFYQVAVDYVSGTSAYIYFNAVFIAFETVTVTARTDCGTIVGTFSFPPVS